MEGIKLDSVIFTNLLKSCSNVGLSSEGYKHFESIVRCQHFSSMIDLFGRVGQLHEAKDLLVTLPDSHISCMPQTSLLANCRTYGNVDLGGVCFSHTFDIDPNKARLVLTMGNHKRMKLGIAFFMASSCIYMCFFV